MINKMIIISRPDVEPKALAVADRLGMKNDVHIVRCVLPEARILKWRGRVFRTKKFSLIRAYKEALESCDGIEKGMVLICEEDAVLAGEKDVEAGVYAAAAEMERYTECHRPNMVALAATRQWAKFPTDKFHHTKEIPIYRGQWTGNHGNLWRARAIKKMLLRIPTEQDAMCKFIFKEKALDLTWCSWPDVGYIEPRLMKE